MCRSPETIKAAHSTLRAWAKNRNYCISVLFGRTQMVKRMEISLRRGRLRAHVRPVCANWRSSSGHCQFVCTVAELIGQWHWCWHTHTHTYTHAYVASITLSGNSLMKSSLNESDRISTIINPFLLFQALSTIWPIFLVTQFSYPIRLPKLATLTKQFFLFPGNYRMTSLPIHLSVGRRPQWKIEKLLR